MPFVVYPSRGTVHATTTARGRPPLHLAGPAVQLAHRRLTVLITYEVFSRYVLNNPHDWNLNVQIMLYGTLFMMAAPTRWRRTATCAATCSTASSSRARRPPSTCCCTSCSSCPASSRSPGRAGTTPTRRSPSNEQTFSATPLPIYPFKFVIPIAGGMLLLQGIVEIVRCIQCPRRRLALARGGRGGGRRRQAQGRWCT